jgi:endo-1,3-1,4-beta-glycanase ExoK
MLFRLQLVAAALVCTCMFYGCGGGASPAPASPTTPMSTAPSPIALNNWNDTTLWHREDNYSNGGAFTVGWRSDHAVVNGSNLVVTLDKTPCPSGCSGMPYASDEITSVSTYGYGTYTVQMQAAKASGVVSTFFTYINTTRGGAATNDEIDVEIPGARTTTLEATYYKLGGAGVEHTIQLPFDASLAMHTYSITWLPNSIGWSADGQVLYTAQGSSATLPTTPSNLILNFWTGSTPGIVNWLGAFTYSGPLHAQYGSASFTPAQ